MTDCLPALRSIRNATHCFLLGLFSSYTVAAEEVRLVGEAYCPFTCSGDKPGFSYEIVEDILTQQGYSVSYKNIPWSRALRLVKKGSVSGVVGVVKGAEPDLVYPNEPIGVVRPCYFTLPKNQWEFTTIGSLRTEVLGAVIDYGYGTELKHYIQNHPENVVTIVANNASTYQLLNLLHRGRITTFTEDISIVQYTVKQNSHFNVRTTGCDQQQVQLHIGFSPHLPQAAQFTKMIDEGIAVLRRTGKLQRILSKYATSDWE